MDGILFEGTYPADETTEAPETTTAEITVEDSETTTAEAPETVTSEITISESEAITIESPDTSEMDISSLEIETTTNTEMSVANSYLSDIASTNKDTYQSIVILLVFILVAICFNAGLFIAKSLRKR